MTARDLTPRFLALAAVALLGCGGPPTAPAHPTWTDVEPILRGQCTQCHGATAKTTGNGVRFDFYDLNVDLCGDAAQALGPNPVLAKDNAAQIAWAISSDRPEIRPSMPPLPADYLQEWEWKTILRWVADPKRGARPASNVAPNIRIEGLPAMADKNLDVNVVLEDADGDPVAGVLTIGSQQRMMDRSGSFSTRLDTATWAAGDVSLRASLCDGWSNVTYALGTVKIAHSK